jgi:hypothetical protein
MTERINLKIKVISEERDILRKKENNIYFNNFKNKKRKDKIDFFSKCK